MTATMLWKKFDCLGDSRAFLDCSDECFYARDYVSRGGYGASETNNLITNFKKPVSRRGMSDWKYKLKAIRTFADDLLSILPDGCVVAAIPTSKSRQDPEYDSRLDDVLVRVVEANPSIRIETPVIRATTAAALHHGGNRRVSDVLRTLSWVGFSKAPSHIVLIDDVITCGSHFKACKQLVLQYHSTIEVYGVFWARTVWTTNGN
jgi:predicted amidophosphoribosyltransferase